MVIEINRLSLNSDGAFRTMMHKRMPHNRNKNSTANRDDERLGPVEPGGSRGSGGVMCLPYFGSTKRESSYCVHKFKNSGHKVFSFQKQNNNRTKWGTGYLGLKCQNLQFASSKSQNSLVLKLQSEFKGQISTRSDSI